MTPAKLQDLRDQANAWAREHAKADGFVVFWRGSLSSWSVSRARLESAGYLPGVIAIPIGIGCNYAALVAVGGNYESGCERWEELKLEQPPFNEAESKANCAHVACWTALLANLEAENNRGLYDRALLTNLAAIADHDRPNWCGYYVGRDLGDRIRALPAWDDPQLYEG